MTGGPTEQVAAVPYGAREHLAVLFRHKRKVLGIFIASVMVAGPGSLLLTKIYRSEIRVLVKSSRQGFDVDAMLGGRGLIGPKDYVKSEVAIFGSPLLAERAVERLGVTTVLKAMQGQSVVQHLLGRATAAWTTGDDSHAAVQTVTDNLDIKAIVSSDVFEVKFESPDPEFAALALNTLAELYLAHHLEVRQGEGTSPRDAGVSLIEPAAVPWRPVRPRKRLNLLLGLIVGSIGGVGSAYLCEYVRRSFATKEEIDQVLGRRLSASLPLAESRASTAVGGIQLQQLSRTVYWANRQRGLRSLLVTSAKTGEGKSYVATALARSLSREGFRLLLIHHKAEIGRTSSEGGHSAEPAPTEDPNLSVMAAMSDGETAFTYVERIVELVANMRNRFDLVLINGPAVDVYPEWLGVASAVDGILVVVEAERTPRVVVAGTVQMLEEAGGHIVGVVLNKRRYVIPARVYNSLFSRGANHAKNGAAIP